MPVSVASASAELAASAASKVVGNDHVGGVEPLVADGARRVAGDRVRFELRQLLSFDWEDGKDGVPNVI